MSDLKLPPVAPPYPCPQNHEQIDAVSQETAGRYGRCAYCGAYLEYRDGDWRPVARQKILEGTDGR